MAKGWSEKLGSEKKCPFFSSVVINFQVYLSLEFKLGRFFNVAIMALWMQSLLQSFVRLKIKLRVTNLRLMEDKNKF